MSDINDNNEFAELFKEGEERILIAAWTLSNEGGLTDTKRREAMDNFHSYIKRNNLTVNDVARQLGDPKEKIIHDLLKKVYRGSVDANIRTLNHWIEQHARTKQTALHKKFVSTKVAKDILAVSRLTRENKTIGLICGPSGIGKTRCALAVHEKYVGSIYMRVITGYHHSRGIIHAIAGTLGLRLSYSLTSSGQHQTQLERVISALRNTERMIIIDEAHDLQDTALQVMRDIHDTTGVPILLFATRDLHERIVKTADPDHGQLYSRVDVVHHLTEGHDIYRGGKALFTVDQIKQLYDEQPVRLSRDGARYLQDIANELGRGSLRRCEVVLRNAVRRARKRQGVDERENVTVTADDLEYVEQILRRELSEQQAIRDRRKLAAEVNSG